MSEEIENRASQISAYKREKQKQLYRAYYLVIADIYSKKTDRNNCIIAEPVQLSTASRLRNQIELIR